MHFTATSSLGSHLPRPAPPPFTWLSARRHADTIGGTPQPNGWSKDWVEFYRDRRLGHMLKLAGGWVGGCGRLLGHTFRDRLQAPACMAWHAELSAERQHNAGGQLGGGSSSSK